MVMREHLRGLQKQLAVQLHDTLRGRVLTGPFAGMLMLQESSWSNAASAAMLLGCYEQELHASIWEAVSRQPHCVVNIGCADGYYAVGLARLMPGIKIYCADVSANARENVRKAADLNECYNIEVVDIATAEDLNGFLPSSDRSLIVSDCEGAEVALLHQERAPHLRKCDMIIECHDFLTKDCTNILVERFMPSHQQEFVFEEGRDPNKYRTLRHLNSLDRWLMVNEDRPQLMHWLAAWSV
jgi:hypothetical protein